MSGLGRCCFRLKASFRARVALTLGTDQTRKPGSRFGWSLLSHEEQKPAPVLSNGIGANYADVSALLWSEKPPQLRIAARVSA